MMLSSRNKFSIGEYDRLKKIGDGTYGIVYKAKHSKTGQFVALKRVYIDGMILCIFFFVFVHIHSTHSELCIFCFHPFDVGFCGFTEEDQGLPSTTVREISLLKELKHENIVKLHEIIFDTGHTNQLYLVFELLSCDLKRYFSKCKLQHTTISQQQIKHYLYQILNGISYCHSLRIFHRDLNPQNILIDVNTERIRIADFGLARTLPNINDNNKSGLLTAEVITLWYRPPEILLGSDIYCHVVDIWSIGCIFGEMVNDSNPLFRGDSEICQLMHIFKTLGTPNNKTWPDISKLKYFQNSFPKWTPKTPIITGYEDKLGQDLLSRLLMLDPKKRVTAKQALRHPYFNNIFCSEHA